MRCRLVKPVWLVAVLAAATAVFAQAPKTELQQLILLDGAAVPFESLEIAAGKLSGRGVPADLTLDDLRRIEVAPVDAAPAARPAAIAELRGGGRIAAKSVTIGNDRCRLAWSAGDPLAVAVDLVRAIRFDPAAASPDFDKALATPSAEMDRIFLKDEAGKPTSASGLIDSLTEEQLTIEIGGEKRAIPRARLFGIVIAQPDAAERSAPCMVTFKDGSILGGQTLGLAEGKASLELAAGGTAEFPWTAVARVAIRSSRLAFLSDLKPVVEEQQAIVTFPLPWQRDKSVSGGPLTLGSQVYEKGIGVHARSSLTFAAEGKWDMLAATIGLDAAAGGKGDCIFSVVADGQPLISRRQKGTDPPQDIHVPIAGRELVTLLVEPGEGLDLADHADWCDVRFIKQRN